MSGVFIMYKLLKSYKTGPQVFKFIVSKVIIIWSVYK